MASSDPLLYVLGFNPLKIGREMFKVKYLSGKYFYTDFERNMDVPVRRLLLRDVDKVLGKDYRPYVDILEKNYGNRPIVDIYYQALSAVYNTVKELHEKVKKTVGIEEYEKLRNTAEVARLTFGPEPRHEYRGIISEGEARELSEKIYIAHAARVLYMEILRRSRRIAPDFGEWTDPF